MLIVKVKKGENINKALKRFNRKFRDTGVLNELRNRKSFTKNSERRRTMISKAKHIQSLQESQYIYILMRYKLYKITALMETGDSKEPIIFTFDLPGVDENSVGNTLNKMDAIRRVISVEETTPTEKGQVYEDKKNS